MPPHGQDTKHKFIRFQFCIFLHLVLLPNYDDNHYISKT